MCNDVAVPTWERPVGCGNPAAVMSRFVGLAACESTSALERPIA